MLVDIEKFSFDEVRQSLIVSKELLRQLAERAPDRRCFESYSGAYLSVSDALSKLSQVKCISAEDDYEDEDEDE